MKKEPLMLQCIVSFLKFFSHKLYHRIKEVGTWLFLFWFLDNRTNFTQGGVNVNSLDENSTQEEINVAQGRIGFTGWSGLGGSIFQWHPDLKIGFAFVPTCLHWFDFANLRGASLQKIVLDCVKQQNAQKS